MIEAAYEGEDKLTNRCSCPNNRGQPLCAFHFLAAKVEKMRIAVISTLSRGGAATAAFRTTSALQKAGHSCTFFSLEKDSLNNSAGLNGLTDSYDSSFAYQHLFAHWSGLMSPEASLAGCCELFSDQLTGLHMSAPVPDAIHQAEVIHLHWLAGMIFSPALLHAMRDKKIVWTLHDANAFTGGCHYHVSCKKFGQSCGQCPLLLDSGPADASSRCFALKQEVYSLLTPHIVCPSRWLADTAKSSKLLGNYPVHSIPHCLDTATFKPVDKSHARQALDVSEQRFVLLIGADHIANPRKNCATFFDALHILAARLPDAPIEIVTYGKGVLPQLPYPVRHLGYIADTDTLVAAYSAADIYVHTALLDNLPNTLCEAQCCGTPVLSFNTGGCCETFIPGKTGFLVQDTTPDSLAVALEEIFAKRDALPAMGQQARLFAVEHFSEQKIADAYAAVYELAQPATGLDMASPLGQSLVQNQILSLAAHLHYVKNATEKRLAQSDARIAKLEEQIQRVTTSNR